MKIDELAFLWHHVTRMEACAALHRSLSEAEKASDPAIIIAGQSISGDDATRLRRSIMNEALTIHAEAKVLLVALGIEVSELTGEFVLSQEVPPTTIVVIEPSSQTTTDHAGNELLPVKS